MTLLRARKNTRTEWYFMQNFDVAYRQHRFRSINLLCIMQLRLPPLSIYYMLVKLISCQTRFKWIVVSQRDTSLNVKILMMCP